MAIFLGEECVNALGGYDLELPQINLGEKTINENGVYRPEEDGLNGYSEVTVDIPDPKLEYKEVTPSSVRQVIVADAGFDALESVAVQSVPTQTKTVNENGRVIPDPGLFLSEVIVNVEEREPAYQAKQVSPTESSQTIEADDEYDALSSVTVDAIPNDYVGSAIMRQASKTVVPTKSSQIAVDGETFTTGDIVVAPIPDNYITTDDANATSEDMLTGASGYVNKVKIYGSIPVNGDLSGTITTQGGSYTIPAGHTTGGTVTAQLPVVTLTNAIINGSSFQESSKDYGWRSTVQIPEGYHSAVTLTKDFSSVLPEPETEGAEAQLLTGYDLYDHDGKLINGSMPNNNAVSITLDDTTTSYTVPQGYHNGSGSVSHNTVNIPDPTITVSSSGLITASGSWTKGYTTDNSYSKTQQLSTQAAKTVAPSESEQTAVASGVYTTGAVKVGAISSTYVGSSVTRQAAKTVTPSEVEQTAVASGVYTTGVVKVAAISSTYVGSGVTKQAAKTVAPTTSEQTAVASGVYTTGIVKVGAIQTETKNVTANGTYTPTSGKWFSSVTVAIPVYDGRIG